MVDRDKYFSRNFDSGLITPDILNKTVLFGGCGAGSYMAIKAARLGLGGMKAVDPDWVEMSNLTRTAYTVQDALEQKPKVFALKERLEQVAPFTKVTAIHGSVIKEGTEADDMFDGVDLIVAGTDHFPAQAYLSREAVRRRIPAVFIGVHEGAKGGMVCWYLPDGGSCLACHVPSRYDAWREGGDQATDLPGAGGALVHIQIIDMVALSIVLGILQRGQQGSSFGSLIERLGQRNMAVVRMSPDYAWGGTLVDALLGDLPDHPKNYRDELQFHALNGLLADVVLLESPRGCGECSH